MAKVGEIYTYPLAGARALSHDSAVMRPDGLPHDRVFTLYDPDPTNRTEVGYKRIGQKGHGALARVATRADNFGLEVTASPHGWHYTSNPSNHISVDMFGDRFDGRDMGNESAAYFSELLDEEVRLARVSSTIEPKDRALAPLHIVFASSLARASELNPNVTAARFRPNLVIDDLDNPVNELDLIGGSLWVGDCMVKVNRPTLRCPVPAYDPETGQNLRDMGDVYRSLPKENRTPIFGVYGYPDGDSDFKIPINRGDDVTIDN